MFLGFSFRVGPPSKWLDSIAPCFGIYGCATSFATPLEAAALYDACIAAQVPIPEGMCRVNAQFMEETGWIDAEGFPVEFPPGWLTGSVEIPEGENFMTCAVDLTVQTFTAISPDEKVPVLLGSPAVAPPIPTCPEGDGWLYVNSEFCLQ